MKQIIASRIQTTISIIQGDQRVIIETNNDSPSLIQVDTNGIHIRIQTGRLMTQSPAPIYDSFEMVKPIALPGPITPPPVIPNPEFIKPGFNSWPFQKSLKYVSDLPIQTTEFVRIALKWCEENIEKTKRKYTYELKYYKPKKTMGTYQYASRKITVYVYPSLALKSLCETIIHEYFHHLNLKNKTDQNEYDRLTRNHGYLNNPHEIKSREAEKIYGPALWDFMKRGITVK
jgi:hypothetical protein